MPPTNNNYNYALTTTMMTKHFCISMIFAAIAGGAAFAQEPELNKEITVDKDFVPVEQKATKSNILPEVYNPQVSKGAGKIGYSDWAVPVEVPATAATLPPYGYGTTHNATDNRGYFEFGIGTCLNMLGSAGYRVVDLDGTKMSIWLQHNSTWTGENKSANSPFAIDQHWNDNVIGVDFMHRFGKGDLSVNAFYHYDNFNYFGRMTDWWPATDSTQSINEFRIDVGWTGPFKEKEGLNYSFHAIYNYFGFSKDVFDPVQGNSENHLRLSLNGDYASSEVSHVGVDLDFDFVNYNIHHYMTGALGDSSSVGHENLGVLSVMPYYAYRSNRMSFKLGVNLDVSFNDGAVFRFAPHAEFRYDLLRGLQFYAEADGGKQVNTLSRMFSTNRYMSPRTLPVNSYIPVDVVGGFKVGPFGGFNATIYGGWSKVVDAMMPTLVETLDPANAANPVNTYNRSISQYAVHDMKGWRVGGELAYAFRTIADASVSLTYSPQEENKGYILGDDRAELVLDTKVAFRPIKDLSIMVGYQYRSGRSLIYTSNSGQWLKQDLQDVNFLMLGANYRLNDIVGFFLEFDNILNKRWDTHYGMGTQPIGIIGGVSLLF